MTHSHYKVITISMDREPDERPPQFEIRGKSLKETAAETFNRLRNGLGVTSEIRREEKPVVEITAKIENLRQVSSREGSNEGGWFEDRNGERFYIKFYPEEARARIESMANQIYRTLGIPVPETRVQEVGGRMALVSSEIKDVRLMGALEMSKKSDVLSGFVADAFLGNRDVTGTAYDNILMSPDGHCWRVDNGGSMIYRARGEKKDYPANDVAELDSMRNPSYSAGRVFAEITEVEMKRQARVLVDKITDGRIRQILDASGISDKALLVELQESLVGRRDFIALRFDLSKKTPVFSDLSLEKIGNPNILMCLDGPIDETLNSAKFEIGGSAGEVELKKGDAVLINLPKGICPKILDSITIFHRKAEIYRQLLNKEGWDEEGAYTKILVYDGTTGKWIDWGSSKYAEHRPAGNPEAEILHDWVSSHGEIKPERILIIGDGRGENGIVSFCGLEIECFPENSTTNLEMKFTPGTEFADIKNGVLTPSYGGGVHPRMGFYNKSVPLNHPNIGGLDFPVTTDGQGFFLEKKGGVTGDMRIIVDKKIPLERIEVSVGDTEDLHGNVYKRNEQFRRGWAKLTIFIERPGGEKIFLMKRANVPPRGVLKGSPRSKITLKSGDMVIIRSESDATYLMGLRLQ